MAMRETRADGSRMEHQIDQRYRKLEKIGEGTYGKVYKALERATGEAVAMKYIIMEAEDEGLSVPASVRLSSGIQYEMDGCVLWLLNRAQVSQAQHSVRCQRFWKSSIRTS